MKAQLAAVLLASLVAGPADLVAQERWTLTETARITTASEPKADWVRVTFALAWPDGFVAVGEAQRISLFDQNGRWVRDIGRRGSGPGEFQSIYGLQHRGDTIIVIDAQLQRASLATRDGKPIAAVPLRVDPPDKRFGPYSAFALLSDGSALMVPRTPGIDIGRSHNPPAAPILRVSPAGSVSSVTSVRLGPSILSPAAGRIMSFQPFSDTHLRAVTPTGDALVVVDRTVRDGQKTFRITRFNQGGREDWSRAVQFEPIVVSKRVVDSLVDSTMNNQSGRMPPLDRRGVEAGLYRPPHFPPVVSVLATYDGQTILKRTTERRGVSAWEVYDATGKLRATFDTPTNVRVLAMLGRSIWATFTNADDEPVLARFEWSPTTR